MTWKRCFQLQLGAWPALLPMLLAGVQVAGCRREAPDQGLVVFAAASTADVVGAVVDRFSAETGVAVRCNYAASSTLARQIAAGAPVDLFISADPEWVDDLAARGLIARGARQPLFGNSLVVVGPVGSPPVAAIAEALGDGRIAIADPGHVPAGRYARQALTALGVWTEVEPRLVAARDVRAALHYAELGEVSAAVVYASDARASRRVTVTAEIPADTHVPIRYEAALCRPSAHGRDLLACLRGPAGSATARACGFVPLAR